MKYAWIEAHRDEFSVTRMCARLEVSRSGYNQWRGREPSDRARSNEQLDTAVVKLHAASKSSYGRPRILQSLRTQGHQIGHERVRRSLLRQGLRPLYRRPYRVTTDSNHRKPIADNVLDRRFDGWAPNCAWVGDITYIATDQGWLFLAVVTDLFSHQVVGWSLREDMTREIVIDALRMASFKRHSGKEAGLTFHSDGGSQYASCDFKNVLHEYDITSSMSRKENCWATVRSVNACSETLFGSLKVERQHGKRFKTQREAKDETID